MDEVVTRVREGLLSGERASNGVLRFRGIPYAKPPVGPLRWQPPQPVEPWDNVRPATEYGPACFQPAIPENSLVYGHERTFSEDCLYLNVWTGSVDSAEKRPVLVWLHHGGFVAGWGGAPLYDGTGLARAGAVHVTINYRLGRLGFLAHPALSAENARHTSGNYGLMDQMAALRWVKDNIAAFGGDPDRVTVYGVSAGSYSSSILMTSSLSTGLFDRMIAGSGGAFGPSADSSMGGDFLQTLDHAEHLGQQIMAPLGANTVDEMRALSPETILAARETKIFGCPPGFLDSTYPILDGYVIESDAEAAYRAGRFHDVPLITGSNEHESAVTPFNPDTETYLADNQRVFGPFFERFLALYPAGSDGLTLRSSQQSSSDRLFSWQNWAFARVHAAYATAPVYYYRFAHASPVPAGSYFDQQFMADVGAFHSSEVPFVMRNLSARDWPWRDGDRAMSDMMSGYWLDFMATGNPNGEGRPRWSPFDAETRARMHFHDGKATLDCAPDTDRFRLLDDFYAWARASGGFSIETADSRNDA